MARLDKERIAAAALAVVDSRGVPGFTIRAVAEVLGVTPMAIYYHVKNKAELVALVVSASHKERPLAPLTGAWRDDMLAMARWMRDGVIKHPALGELHRIYPVYTPEIIQLAERWLQLWQQSGLGLKLAVRAAATSSVAIAGVAVQAMVVQKLKPPDESLVSRDARVRRTFRMEDPEAIFDLAISAFIDGLHASLGRKRSRRSASRRRARGA